MKTAKIDILKITVPIPGFDKYVIDEIGEIFSIDRLKKGKKGFHASKSRKMTIRETKLGYLTVSLTDNNGKRRPLMVHRLVALAFIKTVVNKHVVNHKDGNKQNNHFSNLEWVTQAENVLHSHRTGLSPKQNGENNHNSKLSDNDYLEIIKLKGNGVSTSELFKKYSHVHKSTIYRACNKKGRKHLNLN